MDRHEGISISGDESLSLERTVDHTHSKVKSRSNKLSLRFIYIQRKIEACCWPIYSILMDWIPVGLYRFIHTICDSLSPHFLCE